VICCFSHSAVVWVMRDILSLMSDSLSSKFGPGRVSGLLSSTQAEVAGGGGGAGEASGLGAGLSATLVACPCVERPGLGLG